MENDAKGFAMAEMRERFTALANRRENGTATRAISAFNLFQTPEEIATRMAQIVGDHFAGANKMVPGTPRILEPSAGLGRLYQAARRSIPGASFVLVEQEPACAAELFRTIQDGDQLLQRDFLSFTAAAPFDAVIMNPPFKQGRDVKHIEHALGMVRPGGILVALCYNGVRQNSILKPRASTWELLPEGSFREEGTRAEVALLTFNPPS
jgi:hypothetical protein